MTGFHATSENGNQHRAVARLRKKRYWSAKERRTKGFGKLLLLATLSAILHASSPVDAHALDPILAKRLDGEVLRVLDEHHTPSASIAIVQGGRLTYAAAYGQARISPAIPATTEDGLTTRVYDVSAGGRRLKVVEQLLADGLVESFEVQAAE